MTSTVESDLDSVKDTFSSWDSCMEKDYCKYPVIVGIVIGSLIVLSILYCVVKCLCCGAKCCFCCASISKCLCCGCGNRSSGRNRDNKDDNNSSWQPGIKNNGFVQPQPQPYNYQPQYSSAAPPVYSTATFASPVRSSAAAGNADALPAMPSWNDATSKRVETEDEDLEMGDLDKPNPSAEPMLPKFESDSYRYGRDSPVDGDLGAGAASAGLLGATAGASAATANPYGYSRQDSYGSAGAGAGAGAGANPYSAPYARQNSYGSSGTGGQQRTSGSSQPYYSQATQGGAAQDYYNPVPPQQQRQNPYAGYGYDQASSPYASGGNSYAPQQRQPSYGNTGGGSGQLSPARAGFGIAPAANTSPTRGTYQSVQAQSYGQSAYQSDGYGQREAPRERPPSFGAQRKPVQGSWREI